MKDFFDGQWFEVFRCGDHTDSAGHKDTWTEERLDKIATYNAGKHEAPIVIGHPKDNTPAFGWVEEVKRDGKTLLAKARGLVPEFVDMVKQGMFKKRSISLYGDGTLRHIGFLGAMPPAVKGLADIAFEEKDDSITIDFGEKEMIIGHMLERMRDLFIEQFGQEKADRVIARFDLEALKQITEERQEETAEPEEETEEPEQPVPEFKETVTKKKGGGKVAKEKKAEAVEVVNDFTEETAAKEKEFAEREAALTAREEKVKAGEREVVRKEIASFIEANVLEGKLTPALVKAGMGLDNFMEKLMDSDAVVEFSEDNKQVKQSVNEYFRSFVSGLKQVVPFGKMDYTDTPDPVGTAAADKISVLTSNLMKEKPKLTYNQAFTEVQLAHPDLAAEYAIEVAG